MDNLLYAICLQAMGVASYEELDAEQQRFFDDMYEEMLANSED